VTAVLERAAAPPGTYLRKRRARGWYTTVNTYLGMMYGRETTTGATSNSGTVAGPFLPVGVEVGLGLGRAFSIGLFANAVDLGALANYRLSGDDSASTAPEVGFQQVLAPGIGLVLGFSRMPLTIGALWGYAPELRTVSSGGTATAMSVRRWFLFAGYDLPLL